MKKLRSLFSILILSASVCLLNGCGGANKDSIFDTNNAKSLTNKNCYMEEEDEFYKDDQLESSTKTKSWYDASNKRVRIETSDNKDGKTLLIYDGHKKTISYNEKQNEVFIINDDSDQSTDYNTGLPNQATYMLELLRSTHSISMGKEEYINGFKTNKVTAKPKSGSDNESMYNFWIDQDSQIIIKTDIQSSGSNTDFNFESKSVCTKIDFSCKMTDNLFEFKIPAGAKIEKYDALLQYKDVTLKEASDKLGKPILYYEDSKALKLKKTRLMTSGLEDDDIPVIDMDYYKNNVPYFTINATKKVSTGIDYYTNSKGRIDFVKQWKLNVIDDSDIKMIEWEDNGIQYTVHPIDPSISIKDLEKIIGSMIYSS